MLGQPAAGQPAAGQPATRLPWVHPVQGLPLSSGVFGELRTNHLHSGLDYRTGSDTGMPVLAVGDGHLSRIKVSATGYGLALYVDHPNGYTTVYAHLERFAGPIADAVREQQERILQFELDWALQPGQITVKQGQVIAYSGNSGGSGGPHLHFEVRHTSSEDILNPQLFGLGFTDRLPTYWQSLQLVQIPGRGYSDQALGRTVLYPDPPTKTGSSPRSKASKSKRNKKKSRRASKVLANLAAQRYTYELLDHGSPGDSLPHPSCSLRYPAYLEFMARDRQDSNELTTGIYRALILSNRDTLYDFQADRFHFDQTRYGNSVMDYAARILNRSQRYRAQRSPGNALPMYRHPGDGLLHPPPAGRRDSIQIWCYDFNGNRTGRGFTLVRDSLSPTVTPRRPVRTKGPSDTLLIRDKDLQISLLPGTLYDSIRLRYSPVEPGSGSVATRSWRIHEPSIPLHKFYEVRMLARNSKFPTHLRSKVFLRNTGLKGQVAHHAAWWDRGWFVSQARMFGTLDLVVDTVAPAVKIPGKLPLRSRSRGQSLYFKIHDAVSGIADYRCCIGDTWMLTTYDAKNHLLRVMLDPKAPCGNQTVEMVVTDKAGNAKTLRFPLLILEPEFPQPSTP